MTTNRRFSSETCRARAGASGFTLVELMVALSGGLFLSIVVFALARDASRFYQREGRITSATLAGMIGFERLKNDIERAGYLSTPNIQRDPSLASSVSSGMPAGLATLAGLRITPDTPNLSANASFALNAVAGQPLTPDQIVLSGSYSATDEFPVADASTGQSIYLQVYTASMARLGYLSAANSNAQLALLQNVFGATPGLILRVKDQAGNVYFGQIASVTAGTQPCITLSTPLPVRSSGTGTSGLRGYAVGSSANVVNLVRYRVMDLQHDPEGTAWQPLFTASQGAPGEASRTELVRDQLDSNGNVIAGSADVVAEYAVDLAFSVLGQLNPATAGAAPALTQAAPGSATFTQFFAANAQGDLPERVRTVRVRLSVRSREADRAVGIPGAFYRFQVDANSWARVRTFQADVALPNQAGVQW
ncbi:MAG TPA: prepilin-type N-terminal cleavage/methylation domain-containing protein [Polyangiaceae bacterium]|nr:prepilin-type N-terminal cleavage/methylation domain-containing protein [Polyangiaceae bacterium]